MDSSMVEIAMGNWTKQIQLKKGSAVLVPADFREAYFNKASKEELCSIIFESLREVFEEALRREAKYPSDEEIVQAITEMCDYYIMLIEEGLPATQ